MKGMTTDKQPGVADRRAYNQTRLHTTDTEDRSTGTVTTDPQTVLERGSEEARLTGSGVESGTRRDYDKYAEFLNSAFLNLAANDTHDLLNKQGLRVLNKAGDEFTVGGDGTLLLEDESAIMVTLKADSLADKAIHDIITTGSTGISVEEIFNLFPSSVRVQGQPDPYALEHWNDEILKKICEAQIFPKMVDELNYKAVRAVGPTLVNAPGRPGGGVLSPH